MCLACLAEHIHADKPDAEKWHYYHRDRKTLVRQTTNSQAAVTLVWTYSPEGAVLLGREGPVTHLGCGDNAIYDFSTGLIFKRGNYFDPNTGIWLSLGGVVIWNGTQSYRRNRHHRRRHKKWLILLILLLILLLLTGCANDGTVTPTPTCTPTPFPGIPWTPTFTPTWLPTIGPPHTPTPVPTDDPPTPLPSATIVFGGSDGVNIRNHGPDPAEQIPVWNEIGDLVVPYPGSKTGQAGAVNINDYKEKNLVLIGYSSGADSTLLFANMYYEHQTGNNYSGRITDMVLLATTMTDDAGIIDNEWPNILNRLLQWGTDIYILQDEANYGDRPANYNAPPSASGTFFFDSRPLQGHWRTEHLENPPRPGTGTNNDTEYRNYVLNWLNNN